MNPMSLGMFNIKLGPNQILSGPSRVFPGRLSVCRSFGDVEAKSEKHGGNPKVITSIPDVQMIKLSEEIDFIILGCKHSTI
jgi:protein phosphatase PTC2/3